MTIELVQHYMDRLRSLLPYAAHKRDCAYTQWTVMEMIQKSRGEDYSAGQSPACNCGFAALGVIVWAEVGTPENPQHPPQTSTQEKS